MKRAEAEAWKSRVKKPGDAVRARDLYDLARIRSVHDLSERTFWFVVAREFRVACRSRYIDCAGLSTFHEQWEVTKNAYSQALIPKDFSFEEVEASLVAIVHFFEIEGVIPFAFPLP